MMPELEKLPTATYSDFLRSPSLAGALRPAPRRRATPCVAGSFRSLTVQSNARDRYRPRGVGEYSRQQPTRLSFVRRRSRGPFAPRRAGGPRPAWPGSFRSLTVQSNARDRYRPRASVNTPGSALLGFPSFAVARGGPSPRAGGPRPAWPGSFRSLTVQANARDRHRPRGVGEYSRQQPTRLFFVRRRSRGPFAPRRAGGPRPAWPGSFRSLTVQSNARDRYRPRASVNTPGSDLLSHTVTHAVPSAEEGLTTVFGMGTGVSPPLWPPERLKPNPAHLAGARPPLRAYLAPQQGNFKYQFAVASGAPMPRAAPAGPRRARPPRCPTEYSTNDSFPDTAKRRIWSSLTAD